MKKSVFRSRTMWVNLLLMVTAVLPPVREFLISVEVSDQFVVGLMVVVNMILRLMTHQGVALKTEKP